MAAPQQIQLEIHVGVANLHAPAVHQQVTVVAEAYLWTRGNCRGEAEGLPHLKRLDAHLGRRERLDALLLQRLGKMLGHKLADGALAHRVLIHVALEDASRRLPLPEAGDGDSARDFLEHAVDGLLYSFRIHLNSDCDYARFYLLKSYLHHLTWQERSFPRPGQHATPAGLRPRSPPLTKRTEGI